MLNSTHGKNTKILGKQIALREPDEVMKLNRLGSFHQTRLSFMRQLLRRISEERWSFSKPVWNISSQGFGTAIYTVEGPRRIYSLVVFSDYLSDEKRSDRVIATAWDVTFALYDGVPSLEELERLRKNVPHQENGRLKATEIVLGRANKSVRLWNKVVNSLSKGVQPEISDIENVGYLMRTTAVYGSGKFGLCDRAFLKEREELSSPFQAEMLAVYLVRCFVLDLVEFVAKKKGGDRATKLRPNLRRSLGIGNSTGLGMAPFLVNHPTLLDCWIKARETAIKRVRSVKLMTKPKAELFKRILKQRQNNANNWTSSHEIQVEKLKLLRKDLKKISKNFKSITFESQYPWDTMFVWATKNISVEGQEALYSLMLEPYPELVDELSEQMSIEETNYLRIDGGVSCLNLKNIIQQSFGWALDFDYRTRDSQARFWYVSEEKLEPRLGERFEEAGAHLEQPLAIGRDIKNLYFDLIKLDKNGIVGDFLMKFPKHRHIVRRVLETYKTEFGEIRDNLIDSKMKPIDLLRCKLSFFGADRFDPRSDRWVRICMYQNAQFPDELMNEYDDYWPYMVKTDN